MEIKEFKIQNVTPEQSKIIQETLFKNGYNWAGHTRHDLEYLDRENIHLSFEKSKLYSIWKNNETIPEITYQQFWDMYVKEEEFVLPENWCVKTTTNSEILDILTTWKIKISNGKWSEPAGRYRYINKLGVGITDKEENTEITFAQFKQYVLKENVKQEEDIICEECNGEGKVMKAKLYPSGHTEVWETCDKCNGEGYIENEEMSKEELLKLAREKYPIGTKVLREGGEIVTINSKPEWDDKWNCSGIKEGVKVQFAKNEYGFSGGLIWNNRDKIWSKIRKEEWWKTLKKGDVVRCIKNTSKAPSKEIGKEYIVAKDFGTGTIPFELYYTDVDCTYPTDFELVRRANEVEKWAVGTYVVFTRDTNRDNVLPFKVYNIIESMPNHIAVVKNDLMYIGNAVYGERWFQTLEEAEEFSRSLKSNSIGKAVIYKGVEAEIAMMNLISPSTERVYNKVETITIKPKLEALIQMKIINKIKI